MQHNATSLLDPQLTEAEALTLARGLESGSEHLIARALLATGESVPLATGISNHVGAGVEGRIDGRRYRLGKPEFVAELTGTPLAASEAFGGTDSIVALGSDTGWLALFAIGDRLRDEAQRHGRQPARARHPRASRQRRQSARGGWRGWPARH